MRTLLIRLVFAITAIVWCASPADAAVAYVQSKCFADNASTASVAVTLDAPVGSGNTVALLGLWIAATDTSTGAADNQSNAFTAGTAIANFGGNGFTAKPFYKENITNGPVTFTISFSGAITYRDICAMEISGVETTSVLRTSGQQSQDGIGTGTDAVTSGNSAGSATTGDFVWGGTVNSFDWFDGTTYYSGGTGYTKPAGAAGAAGSASLYPIAVEYKTAGSNAAMAATFTHGVGTNDAATFVLVFKAAAGGATPPKRMLLLGVGGPPE